MTLSSTEFQCVVLGDEPAGLRLLRRLAQLEPGWLERGELLWMRLQTERPRPVAVPVRLLAPLDLQLGPTWSPELRLPGNAFPWSVESLAKRAPELPRPMKLPRFSPRLRYPSPYHGAIRSALRHRPELLALAAGLWKAVGRARSLQPETMILMALECTEMAWWDAAAELPKEIREQVSGLDAPPESVSTRNGLTTITFRGYGAVTAKRWVLNLPWHRWQALVTACPGLASIADVHAQNAVKALCPLRLKVAGDALPWTLRPLTVLFDTDEIPEIDSEVWPVVVRDGSKSREVEAWATVSGELSLEEMLDGLKDAYQRVTRLFPFIDDSLQAFDVPLAMETCFSEQQRRDTAARLEALAVERYDFTSFHTQTRRRGIHALMPSLHCHLPYPVGPLFEAGRLLEQFVGKKRLKEEALAMRPAERA